MPRKKRLLPVVKEKKQISELPTRKIRERKDLRSDVNDAFEAGANLADAIFDILDIFW